MGGSHKQTVGYWYKWLLHFGWCRGPVDALLELRAGGATMWQGRMTASGRIHINKPELWGGEDSQGGVVGDWDVMFGEPTQAPNDYLTNNLGGTPSEQPGGGHSFLDLILLLWAKMGVYPNPDTTPAATLRGQSAHRGKLTTVARGGRFGANIPNPKPVSAKVERILTDWQGGAAWYPEKAVINAFASQTLAVDATGWDYVVLPAEADPGHTNLTPPTSGWQTGQAPFGGGSLEGSGNTLWPIHTVLWMRRTIVASGQVGQTLVVQAENGCVVFVDGAQVGAVNQDNVSIDGNQVNTFEFPITAGRSYDLLIKAFDEADSVAGGTLLTIKSQVPGLNAINPAHILYDSIVHDELQGEPAGLINDASFRAAADRLYSEGLGLCTTFDSASETPAQFQQRLCNLIGGCLNQSRVDGLYYLDLIRAPDDLDALPVIGEGDVIAFKQTPVVLAEAPNLMRVEWFDQQSKEQRTTAPIYAAGAIQSAGAIIPDDRKYHEVPAEGLALRLGKRDLDAGSTPRSTFELSVLPRFRGLRPGMNARLQLPSEGIADRVVTVVKVGQGTLRDSKMQLTLVENVFATPDAVYVEPTPAVWSPPASAAKASPAQVAIEAPYIELAATLSSAELQALAPEAGYLVAAAVRPVGGVSYALQTSADGTTYTAAGTGDWCGTATIPAAAGPTDTVLAFAFGLDLDRVEVGSWARWDDEIVRVDAIDADAATLTLGRGCADTVPATHAADSRIYFCGDWLASDSREYVEGETLQAKVLTRTASGELAADQAPAMSVVFAGRAARPYPPGKLRIAGVPYPTTVTGEFTVTWVHRNRAMQADQLVDSEQAGVAPADNLRYHLKFLDDGGNVLVERDDIGPGSATVDLNYSGNVTMSLQALDPYGGSLQVHSVTFAYTPSDPAAPASAISATAYTPVDDTIIFDGGGEPL